MGKIKEEINNGVSRPWCCLEPRCTPISQLREPTYPDASVPIVGQSFICFGMMDQPVKYVMDGVEHVNDLNSCHYAAAKGITRFLENADDWSSIGSAYQDARIVLGFIRRKADG
jgi:hypothetical protein